MREPSDLSVLARGLTVAGSWRHRKLIAGGVLFSASLLALLLALFPGGDGAGQPLETLARLTAAADPTLLVLFLVSASTLLWVIWSGLCGAVMAGIAAKLGGWTRAPERSFARWPAHFSAPLFLLLALVVLAGIALGLLQVVRLPYIGWPLALLLSPVVLGLSVGAVWLLVRWLCAGHLAGPAIAVEGTSAFAGLSAAVAHLRAAPFAVVLLRLLALGLVILFTVVKVALGAAAFGLPGLLIALSAPAVAEPVRATLVNGLGAVSVGADIGAVCVLLYGVLAASWLVSAPLAHLAGARTALYLVHRRRRDGIAVDAPPQDHEPVKSLEELGAELVGRLADLPGEV